MILFFNACSYSMEYTKTVIDNYFTCRTQVPEIFSNREDVFEDDYMDHVLFHFLANTPDGANVLFCKLMNPPVSIFNEFKNYKIITMVYDLFLKREGSSKGHYVIVDCAGTALGHLAKINLISLKKVCWYMQEAMPFKKLGILLINVSPAMEGFFKCVRPFLKSEVAQLVSFHISPNILLERFPKESVPKDYRGTGPSIKEMLELTKMDLAANKDYFKEEETRRVNEKLRMGKPKNSADLFGIEGSFKKLDID